MNTFFEQIEKARKIVHNGSVYYCAYDIEQNLASIKQFTEHFIHRTDIGNEYFEGTLERMLEVFNNCCKQ